MLRTLLGNGLTMPLAVQALCAMTDIVKALLAWDCPKRHVLTFAESILLARAVLACHDDLLGSNTVL